MSNNYEQDCCNWAAFVKWWSWSIKLEVWRDNRTLLLKITLHTFVDSKEPFSYDITYVTEEQRPISGGINTAVGQNEGSLVIVDEWDQYLENIPF